MVFEENQQMPYDQKEQKPVKMLNSNEWCLEADTPLVLCLCHVSLNYA